jgi:hypothetical protein
MREVYKNGHGPNWVAAMHAKYGNKGTLFGRKEFDEILGDFSVRLHFLIISTLSFCRFVIHRFVVYMSSCVGSYMWQNVGQVRTKIM